MGFYDAFFGSEQSQYTAYAIVGAIIAICITILLTATDIPISNRLLIIFFVIISLIPSVFLTLFELTCIVTGGTEPNHWWCHAFAWVLAAFIIIYCIFIVIISLISLFTYNNAIDNVKMSEDNNRLSPEVSNQYAKEIIRNDEIKTKQIEKFYNDDGQANLFDNLTQEKEKEQFQSGYPNIGDINSETSEPSMPSMPSMLPSMQPSAPSMLPSMQPSMLPSMPTSAPSTPSMQPSTTTAPTVDTEVTGAPVPSKKDNFANFGDNLNSNELFSSSFSLL
jgi:uncharacterized membrane protein